MNTVLIEYIETKKLGKIAHFITEDGKHIYSKVLKSDDSIFYQELSQDELKSIEDEINK
jgi:hypothetical protein